jgi:hypothetical protein
MREKATFVGLALIVTVGLFALWPLIVVGLPNGAYVFAEGLFLIPVLAVMLVARGYDWRRKAMHVAVALVGFGLVDLVAAISGAQAVAGAGEGFGSGVAASIVTVFYHTFKLVWPFVVLVHFVDGRPQLLWERASQPRQTRARGRTAAKRSSRA